MTKFVKYNNNIVLRQNTSVRLYNKHHVYDDA